MHLQACQAVLTDAISSDKYFELGVQIDEEVFALLTILIALDNHGEAKLQTPAFER